MRDIEYINRKPNNPRSKSSRKIHGAKTFKKRLRKLALTLAFTAALTTYTAKYYEKINSINRQTSQLVTTLDRCGKSIIEQETKNLIVPLLKSTNLTTENKALAKQLMTKQAKKAYEENKDLYSSEKREKIQTAITETYNLIIDRDYRYESSADGSQLVYFDKIEEALKK